MQVCIGLFYREDWKECISILKFLVGLYESDY